MFLWRLKIVKMFIIKNMGGKSSKENRWGKNEILVKIHFFSCHGSLYMILMIV